MSGRVTAVTAEISTTPDAVTPLSPRVPLNGPATDTGTGTGRPPAGLERHGAGPRGGVAAGTDRGRCGALGGVPVGTERAWVPGRCGGRCRRTGRGAATGRWAGGVCCGYRLGGDAGATRWGSGGGEGLWPVRGHGGRAGGDGLWAGAGAARRGSRGRDEPVRRTGPA
ncbi:hypothetical protein GCM10010300_26780 [Streptomyces olivaceoviridis]|nr:hypothetical protein GCM10010300_26780 [Streptomyces olivaceoviridis]